jgi:pimeloyl-ACP methyl ester carboxylesterase
MDSNMVGLIVLGVLIVIGVPAAAYFAQDSLMFYPQPVIGAGPAAQTQRPVETLSFETDDGVRVRGWLVKSGARAPLIVYYGGNAEEVSWQAADPVWPGGWSLALVNYRGYGASEGAPSERALFADALLVFDALVRRPDVDAARIVLVGRSLGSGVATYVAAERKVAGAILISPYDSMTEVARHHYPWLPVGLLLKHPFDSLARAPRIGAPLLAIAAANDTIIPPEHSRRLYEAWGGPKRWVEIARADHNDIGGQAYVDSIASFLRSVQSSD